MSGRDDGGGDVGGIGTERREVEFEPLPAEPLEEPRERPAQQPAPDPEPVPA